MNRVLGLVGLIGLACAVAKAAPIRISVEEVLAPGDTATYIVRWTAPPVGPQQLPLLSYHIRLVHAAADTFVFHQVTATTLVDTIRWPRPLTLTDSIGPMKITVTAVDQVGTKSVPAITSSWWIRRKAQAPGMPGGITVDSSTVASLTVRPSIVALSPGAKAQFCAFYTLTDSSKGLVAPPSFATQQERDSFTLVCPGRFQAWLMERPA